MAQAQLLGDWSILTGIGHGNGLWVNVTESAAERGQADQRDRAHAANDQGPENCWLLVGGPAKVADGSRPEERGRHGD